ncbi:MAG TPA: hypothetical protein VMV79_03735 [Alphaproteobacteria bacterium]|nr:hypothetical protein [Alphaproteobacteria bacterium]
MPNKQNIAIVLWVLLAANAWADTKQGAPSPFAAEGENQNGFLAKENDVLYVGRVAPTSQTKQWDLLLQTKKSYSCSNTHINAVTVVNSGHVTVNIDQAKPVLEPELCVTSFTPATLSIALPTLDRPLTLDIVNGHNDDRYKISLEANVASVNTVHARFTLFLFDNDRSQ